MMISELLILSPFHPYRIIVWAFPQWQAAAGWLVSLSIMAVIVGSAYALKGQGSPGHAVYQGLHRLLWALAVAWVILACEEGYGGTSDNNV